MISNKILSYANRIEFFDWEFSHVFKWIFWNSYNILQRSQTVLMDDKITNCADISWLTCETNAGYCIIYIQKIVISFLYKDK